MTQVYFVRHAQSDNTNPNQYLRALTETGQAGAKQVAIVLQNVSIDAMYASTYLRTSQTLAPLAKLKGLKIRQLENLREREMMEALFSGNFDQYMEHQWADLTYAAEGCESLLTVQKRNIEAVNQIVAAHPKQTVVVGTHGCALSTILHYYTDYGLKGYLYMKPHAPYIIRLDYENGEMIKMTEIML